MRERGMGERRGERERGRRSNQSVMPSITKPKMTKSCRPRGGRGWAAIGGGQRGGRGEGLRYIWGRGAPTQKLTKDGRVRVCVCDFECLCSSLRRVLERECACKKIHI